MEKHAQSPRALLRRIEPVVETERDARTRSRYAWKRTHHTRSLRALAPPPGEPPALS